MEKDPLILEAIRLKLGTASEKGTSLGSDYVSGGSYQLFEISCHPCLTNRLCIAELSLTRRPIRVSLAAESSGSILPINT